MNAVAKAARELLKDESRREAREQKTRLEPEEREEVVHALDAIFDPTSTSSTWAAKGEASVRLMDFGAAEIDDQAATVIANILWWVESEGYDPLAVLKEAQENFTEEKLAYQIGNVELARSLGIDFKAEG